MSSPSIDLVGKAGDPTTQGLGRLISQYANSPKLAALLAGIYAMGQDLDNLFQRLGRLLNPNDNIYVESGGAYPVNTNPATDDQLRIIGQIVGVTKYLPDGTVLDDADLWQLVMAKIYRNSAVANGPGLRMTCWCIFDPTNALAMQGGAACSSTITLLTDDVGGMGVRVSLIYPTSGVTQPTSTQLALLHLPAGRSNLPYGLIARPAGVEICFQWQPDVGVFSFAAAGDPSTLLTPNGVGFNAPGGTNGTWARSFK